MITSWMLYALAVGALVVIAALVLERVAIARGWPLRLVWVAGLVFLWSRAEPLLARFLAHLESQVPTPKPVADLEPMPFEVLSMIGGETESWARDDKLARAHELYAQHRDWKKVAMALTIEGA